MCAEIHMHGMQVICQPIPNASLYTSECTASAGLFTYIQQRGHVVYTVITVISKNKVNQRICPETTIYSSFELPCGLH